MSDHYIKKIEKINFGLMSPEDIRKMSVVTVRYPDTYGDDGFPIEEGLMDPRMGVIDPTLVCRTCGFRGGDCQGHFGSIELARPVIHAGFGDIIHKILRSTCNDCGRILLNDEQTKFYEERICESMGNKESINNILKDVYKSSKRELMVMHEEGEEVDMKYCCPHCGAPQEAIILDKPVTIRQGDYKLTPAEVRERLERISDEDAFILGVNPEVARPEWLVLTVLPVPPVTARPSITLDTGERSEDDLTHKLVDILRINMRLLENMEAGAPQLIVEDLWELLQYHVTTYFDNEASGVPPARHRSGRPLKTLTQRLKGKEGRFRSNLSGKRVNFSARTVISPDPNISINEVGVPEMIAKEVTVPAYVNEWNIDEMRTYIKNGPDIHPGANYVINGYTKRRVTEETKEFILQQLEPGFIIERHLIDGDMVLFNRQPSLTKGSMMAHEVRVLPYKTFRLNLCLCPPYNADFDGDEMNMHILQSIESIAEAKSLLCVQEHILSPRFGGPIIGAIHDHISGAYLLTRDGVEFTEEEALQIIRKSHLPIPPFHHGQWILKFNEDFNEDSFIYKDKGDNWTGKELFSLLLPNDLNIIYDAEISKCPVVFPLEDTTVVVENGILKQGVIDEAAYGSFSGKILDKLVKQYGSTRAKEFLDKSTDMAIYAVTKFGITTSLNDEEIPEEAQDRINEHLNKKIEEVNMLVQSYEEGYLRPLSGRSLEETLEMKIMQVLGEARDMSGSIAENYLTMGKQYPGDSIGHVVAVENHSVVMARTGARASMLNLTQITACVGQQAVRGERIKRGYLNRTLPHFKKGELGAKARGFVSSSYKSGLDPIEFFFHAMGGREGLVDTAIRTAQSGYMQRRLVNALQDLNVDFNGVVKDNQGNVIQTMFGEDGVDPAKSDFGKPADLNKLIDEIRMSSGAESSEQKSTVNYNPKVNEVKSKLYSLIDKYEGLYNQVSKEIEDLAEYDIKHNFEGLLPKLNNNMDLIEMAIESDDYETLYTDFVKYDMSYTVYKSNFDDEVERINNSYEDLFKKEVISETKIFKALISRLENINNVQRDNESSLLSKIDNLVSEINNLGGNLTSDLQMDKETLLYDCHDLKNSFESNIPVRENLSSNISEIYKKYEELSNYPRVNKEFSNKSYHLEIEISNLKENFNKHEHVLEVFESKFNDLQSDFDNLINSLNRIDEIINDLTTLREPIAKIEEDISNQIILQDSLENKANGLYDELIEFDNNLSQDLEKLKNDIIKSLDDLIEDISGHRGFDTEYRPHFPVLKRIYDSLIQLSIDYSVFEVNYSLLNEHISKVRVKIKYHHDLLDELEEEYMNQKYNYDKLIDDFKNMVDEREKFPEDIYAKIMEYKKLLQDGLISQDDFELLKRNLIKDIDNDDKSNETEMEDNDVVLDFRKFIKTPFFGFARNQFPNISDDEVENILKEIELDIVHGKITGGNWSSIVKERFEKFNQGEHVNKLNNMLDDLISNSEFYRDLSKEFSDLSDDEKMESINKLKNMFTSDFKQEDIQITLKIIFEQKRKEKHDLNLLNKYWNNLNVYMVKYNLYEDELVNLLLVAQKDIQESKLSGITFGDYMQQQFNNLIEENKTAARSKFALFINKRSKLMEFTMLNSSQVVLLIDDVQLLISKNEIRDNQITEEFLIKRSLRFRR